MELKRRRKIQKCSTRVLLLNQFAIEFDFAFGDDFLQVLVFGIFRSLTPAGKKLQSSTSIVIR